MKTAITILSISFVLILSAPVQGQNFFWSGSNGSSWANGENWAGGQAPTGGENANLFFANTANSAAAVQDISNPITIGNMAVDSSNGMFDIRGGGIVLDSGKLEVNGSQNTRMTNDLGFTNGAGISFDQTGSFTRLIYEGTTITGNQAQAGGVVEVTGNGIFEFRRLVSMPAHLQIESGVRTVFQTGSSEVNISNGFDSNGIVSLGTTNLKFDTGANINQMFVNGNARIAAPSSSAITVTGATVVDAEAFLDIADETVLNGSGVFFQNQFSSSRVGDASVIDKNVILESFSTMEGASLNSMVQGSMTMRGASLFGELTINNDMQVENGMRSIISAESTISVNGNTVVANGTLEVSEAALLNGKGNAIVFQGSSIDMQFGTIEKGVMVEAGGALTGNGEIIGKLDMFGMIAPGNSAGLLEIDGDIEMAETTITCVELGGAKEGEYDVIRDGRDGGGGGDRLLGANTAFLDGELIVTLIDGYMPSEFDEFMFVQGFLIQGEFSNTGGGGINSLVGGGTINIGDGIFNVEYGSDYVRLFGFQAVPEPGAALLLTCFGLATFSRRRRR